MATDSLQLGAPAAQTRNRAAWLELSRVLAMMVVMFEHIPYKASFNFYSMLFFWAPVSFFFFTSGFLYGKKAHSTNQWVDVKRAWLLFLPFLFWQAVTLGSAFGLRGVCEDISLKDMTPYLWFSQSFLIPANSPLWFLRDLAFLSLLSPLLIRFRRATLFLALAIALSDHNLDSTPFFPPANWSFYLIGLFFNHLSIEDLKGKIRQSSTYILALFCLLTLAMLLLHQTSRGSISPFLRMSHGTWYSLSATLIGVCAILALGVWFEERFPKISQKISPMGMSSFLVYAMHVPILSVIKSPMLRLNLDNTSRWGILSYFYPALLALVIYAVCHLFYLAI